MTKEAEFVGKRLLILGGAYPHRKLVKRAREMGIETYVTDFLELADAPAKQMADHAYYINITEMDRLEQLCRKERIDGVIGPYLDAIQLPYQQLCERMGYPCFGDARQHKILTDKTAFKAFCLEHGADVIPGYTKDDIAAGRVAYPVLIKPADSRGSRGQSICYHAEETPAAIAFAASESSNGEVIIEKYMQDAVDIQLVYLVIHGEPLLYKVEDRFVGSAEHGFDKLAIASIAPSRFEDYYREKMDAKVRGMLRALGLQNTPVFLQAFMDREKTYLYDPGIRMPGDDYDDAHREITGIDVPELLIRFALTGDMPEAAAEQVRTARMHEYDTLIMPCVKPGKIGRICGFEEIDHCPWIPEWSHAYRAGDVVQETRNVKQRFGEFVLRSKDKEDLRQQVEWLFDTLHVLDEQGEDMLIEKFDTRLLEPYAW